MKDLAVFMEGKASGLLDEFVIWRELRSGREIPKTGRLIQESEEAIVRGVVDSFKSVIDTIKVNDYPPQTVKGIFTSIFSGIQDLLPNGGNLFQTSSSSTTTSSSISLPEDISSQVGFVVIYSGFTYIYKDYTYYINCILCTMVQGLSHFAEWPNICQLLWYPYHGEKCGEARCLACAPAMMASAQVCRLTEGRVTRGCVERSLQSKYCNFCIRKYVHNWTEHRRIIQRCDSISSS